MMRFVVPSCFTVTSMRQWGRVLAIRPHMLSLGKWSRYHSFIYSFIHSGYFYSTSSSPPPLRGALDTARILCRNFTLINQLIDCFSMPFHWQSRTTVSSTGLPKWKRQNSSTTRFSFVTASWSSVRRAAEKPSCETSCRGRWRCYQPSIWMRMRLLRKRMTRKRKASLS